jgi:hypothetical protein
MPLCVRTPGLTLGDKKLKELSALAPDTDFVSGALEQHGDHAAPGSAS